MKGLLVTDATVNVPHDEKEEELGSINLNRSDEVEEELGSIHLNMSALNSQLRLNEGLVGYKCKNRCPSCEVEEDPMGQLQDYHEDVMFDVEELVRVRDDILVIILDNRGRTWTMDSLLRVYCKHWIMINGR